ncbi:MAG TPA: RHS repeat-associated core domain-containing protein [Candidatus Dormibacteraeota bacterium]|nr:RHS repeat-associated core domain-containing protein [Candidatus Dormibacteraeota bacterium]
MAGHRAPTQWEGLPPLGADAGVTAVAGQALRLDGLPLAGVTLTIGLVKTTTDDTGRFLLSGVPAGRQTLHIDGTTADVNGATYGYFEYGFDVTADQTNPLGFPIWMTKLDTSHMVKIPSPTTKAVVLTNPDLPGLEVHLQPGTVVQDSNGKVVTEVSLTAIPIDQPPFPLPVGVDLPVYFTVQPAGGYLNKPAQIVYPNFGHLAPKTTADFWDYDPDSKGWFVYGSGHVTPNAKQVKPDPGTVIWEFSGAMFNSNNPTPPPYTPPPGPPQTGGDPVDLSSGVLDLTKTDLALTDTLSLVLSHTHLQADPTSRAFGVGGASSFDIFLHSQNQYQEVDLYLPGQSKIHYVRTSSGTGWTDAVFQTTTTDSTFLNSTIAWNGNGWNLTRTDGTVMVWGENAPLQSITDHNGNQITFIRSNGVSGVITDVLSQNGRWMHFTNDSSGRITQVQDNIGRTVKYDYDTSGRLWHVTDPAGGVTTYTYDTAYPALNDIKTITDPLGITYLTNVYNSSGQVTEQDFPDGTSIKFSEIGLAVPPPNGQASVRPATVIVLPPEMKVVDQRGITSTTTFDFPTTSTPGGDISTVVDAGGPDQQSSIETLDATTLRVIASTQHLPGNSAPVGMSTAFGYDSTTGGVNSVTQWPDTSESATSQISYGVFGQVTGATDPLGHVSALAYDPATGNLQSIVDPNGGQSSVSTLSDGQIQSMTDPLGDRLTFGFDQGLPTSVTDGLNRTTTVFSDGAGRALVGVDAAGNQTSYQYNSLDEVTSMVDASGANSTYGYDGDGNVKSIKDAAGHSTAYAYDSMNRLTTVTDAAAHVTRYGYDKAGELLTVTDPQKVVTHFDRDDLGRITEVEYNYKPTTGTSFTADSTISYTYDSTNKRVLVNDSLNGNLEYDFDDFGREVKVISPQGTVLHGYDAAGRLTSTTIGVQAPLSYQYDNASNLVAILQGGTKVVSEGYDKAGRLQSVTLPDGIVETGSHDAASQLTGITYKTGTTTLGTLTYGYDATGHMISEGGTMAATGLPAPVSSATYNSINELATWGGATVGTNADGQITSENGTTLGWNSRGQLTSSKSSTTTASYTYDAAGNRVGTKINNVSTSYLYNGGNVGQITSGSTTSGMISGGINQWFGQTTGASTQSFLTDGLGSTLGLANSSGAVTTNYTYDPFGNPTASGAASSNTFQFAGEQTNASGLQLNGARYYSPTLQRFVSQDPAGYNGSGSNLYAYVGDDPTNLTDPSGLAAGRKDPGPNPPGPNPGPNPPSPPCHENYLYKTGDALGTLSDGLSYVGGGALALSLGAALTGIGIVAVPELLAAGFVAEELSTAVGLGAAAFHFAAYLQGDTAGLWASGVDLFGAALPGSKTFMRSADPILKGLINDFPIPFGLSKLVPTCHSP